MKRLLKIVTKQFPIIFAIIGVLISSILITLLLINDNRQVDYSTVANILIGIFTTFAVIYTSAYTKKLFQKRKVFITYSYNDKKFVDKLYKQLQEESNNGSRKLSFLLDDTVISLGDNILDKLKQTIDASDAYIVVLNTKEKGGDYLKFEINSILNTNKKIIPVITGLSDNNNAIPEEFKDKKYLKISDYNQETIKNTAKLIIDSLVK